MLFLVFQGQKSQKYNVLKVISPTEIIVTSQKGEEEHICAKGLESFLVKPDENQLNLANRLKITPEDTMGLGYLADNFSKEHLAEKEVKITFGAEKSDNYFEKFKRFFRPKIETEDCKPAKIYSDNQDYGKLLLEAGLAVQKNKPANKELKKNIETVRHLELRIFNNKSRKYHKLSCKYGLMAHNIILIPQSQIPKDAKPCKFCFNRHKECSHCKKFKYFDDDIIPNVPMPPETFKSGAIEIFLTDMTRVLKPSNSCSTPVCRALVREVNNSKDSIDFAIYGYTKIPALQQALKNAQGRGVKIRFVYDVDAKSKNLYPDTLYLANLFKDNNADFAPAERKYKSKYQSAIMHNKFFIFDGKTVFTGSANISNTDMSGFNSNAIILLKSQQIAQIYEKEFEQMYSGKFHKSKLKIKGREPVTIDQSRISVYFSPKDKIITTQLIPLVNQAHKYIYMPVFLLTHKELTQCLIEAAQRGVAVKVILDATNAHGAHPMYKILREHNIPVKTENLAGKLHSKSMIIDDKYTIIGSMNFSKSGEGENDENLLIIENREIALFYKQFFQYLWKRIPDKWLKLNARAESPDSIGSCKDGIDNDFDGKIDMMDDSCRPQIKKIRKIPLKK